MDLDSNFEVKKDNSNFNYEKYLYSLNTEDEELMNNKENNKKSLKDKNIDKNKKKHEKINTDFLKIDLDKSDSIDDFIKFLSSQENISIDDLLSLNINTNNKNQIFTNDKMYLNYDNRNIVNNMDFNFNDNILYSDVSYNCKYILIFKII